MTPANAACSVPSASLSSLMTLCPQRGRGFSGELDQGLRQPGGLLLALFSYPFGVLFGAIGKGLGKGEVEGPAANEAMRVLGGLGSAFVSAGFIATLISLINLAQNIDSIETLGPGLGTAAITLYYALFLKYAILDPLKRSVEHRKV